MIRIDLFRQATLACAAVAATSCAWAQSGPAVASPKLREKVIETAERVVESRTQSAPLPSPLPNPFIAKQAAQPEVAPSEPAPPAQPAVMGIELLSLLAAQIPATGTVVLGGEPILLLGQKRLKVGDSYTISFEGETYEVSIAAITSTSFTVKRGALLFSRPVRLSR